MPRLRVRTHRYVIPRGKPTPAKRRQSRRGPINGDNPQRERYRSMRESGWIPAYQDFGPPAFVDEKGRQYRLARGKEKLTWPLGRETPHDTTVLFARIPKKSGNSGRHSHRGTHESPYFDRWPRYDSSILLFHQSEQRLASGRVQAVWSLKPGGRGAVARIHVTEWAVSTRPVSDPGPYLEWGA